MSGRRSRLRLVVVLWAAMAAAHAAGVRAEPRGRAAGTQEEQARAHFQAGQDHYRAGRFEAALHEFELGYALSPRPEFLINFAQVYRRLAQYDRAIVECERFLATAPPRPVAEEAEKLLAQLREEQAAASTSKPPAPVDADAQKAAPAPAPVTTSPLPVVAAPAPAPERPKRRAWVWAVTGTAIALAVGAGITLAIVLSPPRETFPSAAFGRVDFR